MGFVRVCACFVALAACFVTVGCGGGGSHSGGTVGAGRDAIHEPVQSRGIKGEDPSTEAATRAHISADGCKSLATLAEERLGTGLAIHSDPSPPLSRCRLTGPGTSVAIYLDTGFAAHQRYGNRIEETVQFNAQHPAGLPHPVPGVGERAAYNADANWIPALRSLLALRGNRWLTLTISAAGHPNRSLEAEAAVLARAGFKLTAAG
jgi:uncharacterized RmlC-like cupin family protein